MGNIMGRIFTRLLEDYFLFLMSVFNNDVLRPYMDFLFLYKSNKINTQQE